jgi:hypothetical protein
MMGKEFSSFQQIKKTPSWGGHVRSVPRRFGPKDIRNIRIGYFVLALIFVFLILIPLGYTWRAEIPPSHQLRVTAGTLTYQEIGKRGNRLTGIETKSGTFYFTCSKGKYGSYPDCLFPLSEYEKLSGKPATVWWFEQPVYLFSTQKRLVRLDVSGEEKVSYEKTLKLTKSSAEDALWFIGAMFIAFISIVVWFERMIGREKHE